MSVKARRQSLGVAGTNLKYPCCSHGRLYIAFARVIFHHGIVRQALARVALIRTQHTQAHYAHIAHMRSTHTTQYLQSTYFRMQKLFLNPCKQSGEVPPCCVNRGKSTGTSENTMCCNWLIWVNVYKLLLILTVTEDWVTTNLSISKSEVFNTTTDDTVLQLFIAQHFPTYIKSSPQAFIVTK